MRGRLLASSMITGAALFALGAAAAHAADSTSEVTATANSTVSITGASNGPAVSMITASADATADTSSTAVTEVVVTGSRIPQPNLTSISPIESVGHQEFQLEGHTDVVDMLNNLPQEFQNNVSDFSNTSNSLAGPGGISTADLRGLGPQRTLVLVNGRRLGIGDPNTGNPNPAPDLDQIPAAMIDHVEVVTGGASATYGSDAVAGVINFVLKKDFEGLEVDGTLGGDQHTQHNSLMDGLLQDAITGTGAGSPCVVQCLTPVSIPGNVFDGGNEDASVIFGANSPDDKGNVTAYFEFRNQEPVAEGSRDFSACKLTSGTTVGSGACTGSENSNGWYPLQGPGCPGGSSPGGSGTCTVVGTNLLSIPQAGTTPSSLFNSNHYAYIQRADTRYLAGFEAHYDFNQHISLYSEFSFMNDRSDEHIAPDGLFFGGNTFDPNGAGGYNINCNNPLLSTQEAGIIGCSPGGTNSVDVLIGRRNIEGGPRDTYYEHTNFRGVLGLKGDFGGDDAWQYDFYGSYYYTSLYDASSNYLSNTRIQNALDVVDVGGVPTCESVVNGSSPGCVPYNIFQTGGVTQAALNYLNIVGTEYGTTQEQIVEGDITGDLGKYGIKSPWATDGIGVSFGFDWRRDQLNFQPDAIIGSGDLSGGSGVGATINNGIGVWEGYGETHIPIVQKAPFADLIEVDGGVRYSAYSTGPTPTTYKVGFQWAPIEDVRLRASYQVAIRAPSIIELYDPVTITQSDSFGVNGDPCAGATPTYTLAQCENTGVTASQYGHIVQCFADQCDASSGGNPDLKPETADTYSVGATITPRFLKGFTASIDWWDIKEMGFVGSLPPNIIVSECALTGQATFCDLIHRAPSTGFLFGPSSTSAGGYVVGSGTNIAAGEVSGIDFQGSYRLDLEDVGAKGVGSLSFDLNGSLMLKDSTDLPGITPYDCTGLFGSKCQTVNPAWRHTFRVTWNTPWNVLASLQWRYISGVSLDTNSSNPTLNDGVYDAFNAHMPAVSYLDLSGEWRVNTHLTVRGGINNILDQDPPVISADITGTGTPNSYPRAGSCSFPRR
jgi:outer membrane receptor protein involved in Fe transport